MARLFWVAVGAAGGIYAYRKGEQAADAVRARGVAGTAQIVALGALQALSRTGGEPAGEAGVTLGGFRISKVSPAPARAIVDTGTVDITDARSPAVRTAHRTRRKAT